MKRKLNNASHKYNILKLRSEGKSYNEIKCALGCSKSTISYHCGNGNEKKRVKSQVKKRKPICKKVSNFKRRCSKSNYQKLGCKLKTFKRRSGSPGNRTNTIVNSVSKNYSCKDVIDKMGENPLCYLTGKKIDLNDSKAYHLDHIIPASRGGSNDLNNLQICIKEANQAKGQLLLEELYELCANILAWRDKNNKLS